MGTAWTTLLKTYRVYSVLSVYDRFYPLTTLGNCSRPLFFFEPRKFGRRNAVLCQALKVPGILSGTFQRASRRSTLGLSSTTLPSRSTGSNERRSVLIPAEGRDVLWSLRAATKLIPEFYLVLFNSGPLHLRLHMMYKLRCLYISNAWVNSFGKSVRIHGGHREAYQEE